MELQLFIIDDYRIWAKSMEDAQKHYQMIIRL
jgi:hypothetical protein